MPPRPAHLDPDDLNSLLVDRVAASEVDRADAAVFAEYRLLPTDVVAEPGVLAVEPVHSRRWRNG